MKAARGLKSTKMKRLAFIVFVLSAFQSFAQSDESFLRLGSTDSTIILTILQAVEETNDVEIATMKVYSTVKGSQRVFVWWKVEGRKENWTRGMFLIDRTQKNVVGYSIDANRKHPKAKLLNDSKYIEKLLLEAF